MSPLRWFKSYFVNLEIGALCTADNSTLPPKLVWWTIRKSIWALELRVSLLIGNMVGRSFKNINYAGLATRTNASSPRWNPWADTNFIVCFHSSDRSVGVPTGSAPQIDLLCIWRCPNMDKLVSHFWGIKSGIASIHCSDEPQCFYSKYNYYFQRVSVVWIQCWLI